ncbi:ribonuclease PH [Deinococcus irradiatisoli]|uniref:Ribonuclease PH n=1 Tax=Deinococcus irradiatisoli TaxID=2202254 RepID=A0A2Z3JE53_9DEIO|nr:ribonuclease PH [Deinococcus irradiatisoli]AWN23322.1 ribonuclease PH [Deinococcus irradiatisoli]
MRAGRSPLEPRSLKVSRQVNAYAEGSALVELGQTRVLATVSLDPKVPPHMRGKKEGWLMAEYSMLPRATHDRLNRERNLQNGRRHEIQRLLGRSFRSSLDLKFFKNQTLIVDCDVLQADGGTRVTSVLAGYAALFDLADRLIKRGTLSEWPLLHELGAVSVGYVGGQLLVDLEYSEDMQASADLNVVATGSGLILEAQGGAEGQPITPEQYSELLRAGVAAAGALSRALHAQL